MTQPDESDIDAQPFPGDVLLLARLPDPGRSRRLAGSTLDLDLTSWPEAGQ